MRGVRCSYSRSPLGLSLSSRSSSPQPPLLQRLCYTRDQPSASLSLPLRTRWAKPQPTRVFCSSAAAQGTIKKFDGPPPDFSGGESVDVALEGSIQGFDQLSPWPQTEAEDEEALRDDERQNEEQEQLVNAAVRPPPSDEAANPVVQRFERLIAYRLALQMLLQLQLGGRPRYRDVHDMRTNRDGFNERKVATIMQRLKQVTAELDVMRDVPVKRLQWGLDRDKAPPEVVRLNNQLFHLMDQYKTRGLTVQGLVDRFATIVMESAATPDNRTYTQMIQLFGQVNREDLMYLVLSALHDSGIVMDIHTVHAVLWSFAATRDVRMFDAFLSDLTHTNARVISPWEWRRINGTLVPVPASFSSVTTLRLIAVALSCDQPDRAEAWATLMAEEKPLSLRRLTMMKNFLRYYTYQQNWGRGKLWIAEIIAFASHWDRLRLSPRLKPEQEIRLAILRSLHLSYTCWKSEVYDSILAAAAKHGIDPPPLPLQFYSRSAKHVHHQWAEAAFAADLAPVAEELSSNFYVTDRRLSTPFVFISAIKNQNQSQILDPHLISSASAAPPDQTELINAQQSRIRALEDQLALVQQTARRERTQWHRERQVMLDSAARHEQQFDRLMQKLDALKRGSEHPL
ncbi:hypothetical protein DV738_g2767, partial [Chaetothyriales sp. CBS 135597]